MAIDTVTEAPQLPAARKLDFGSSARLWGGFFGRAWLWFLAACLIVTFLPMLFGWRPYVVESGSMQPRIKVGDVIMSSPEHDAKKLLGHVTIFNDPSRPGSVKSHRVISINKDGTLQTKGDANPSPDSVPVPMSDVKGLGRLLVRWIGLPLIWVQNGQWVKLALLVGSLWLAAFLVVRDRDEPIADEDGDETDDETDGDSDDGDAGPDGDADPDSDDVDELNIHRRDVSGRHLGENDPNAPLQWHPRGSTLRRFRKARHREPSALAEFCRSLAGRSGIVVVTVAGLLVPTAQAARGPPDPRPRSPSSPPALCSCSSRSAAPTGCGRPSWPVSISKHAPLRRS